MKWHQMIGTKLNYPKAPLPVPKIADLCQLKCLDNKSYVVISTISKFWQIFCTTRHYLRVWTWKFLHRTTKWNYLWFFLRSDPYLCEEVITEVWPFYEKFMITWQLKIWSDTRQKSEFNLNKQFLFLLRTVPFFSFLSLLCFSLFILKL